MEEVVAGLSSLELHLFISVLHIHGNAQKGSNSNIANTTGSMLMLVNKVLAVCDMLTEVLKQKVRSWSVWYNWSLYMNGFLYIFVIILDIFYSYLVADVDCGGGAV